MQTTDRNITLINFGETFEHGIHYWFGNEITQGTLRCDGQYTCPNCNKGSILFWCPMSNDEDEIAKLNYDPYLKFTDFVSDEDAKKFKNWIMTRL